MPNPPERSVLLAGAVTDPVDDPALGKAVSQERSPPVCEFQILHQHFVHSLGDFRGAKA
jgi:hypothetical protein